jgi:hypothetical protein
VERAPGSPCQTRSRIAEDTLSTKSKLFSRIVSVGPSFHAGRSSLLHAGRAAAASGCRVTGFCLFLFPARPPRPSSKAQLPFPTSEQGDRGCGGSDGGDLSWVTTSSVLWRVRTGTSPFASFGTLGRSGGGKALGGGVSWRDHQRGRAHSSAAVERRFHFPL